MKRIKGYEDYLVTVFGNIYSFKSSKWLKPQINKFGYLHVGLYKNGNINPKAVHRLVAETFIPNPDNKPCVNHKDGIKTNNCVNNLEWATYSENHKHAFKMDLKNHKGIKNPYSKLSEIDVFVIHGLHLFEMKQNVISKLFNITESLISNIVKGKTWKHLIYGKEFQ